jgi:hypothetical protein
LYKKAEKSRNLTGIDLLIPTDSQVFSYLESSDDARDAIANEMTPEQLNLASFIEDFLSSVLEWLIEHKIIENGRADYIAHIRKGFLETAKDRGLNAAIMGIFSQVQEDNLFSGLENINSLTPQKFFVFSLARTGIVDPSHNVMDVIDTYSHAFFRTKAFYEILPEVDLYITAMSDEGYVGAGKGISEKMRSFYVDYINNKKGKRLPFPFKQGENIDVVLRGIRAFTTFKDLGFNIFAGLGAHIGEKMANLVALGAHNYALGHQRRKQENGKVILAKYENFIGRSWFEEAFAPGANMLHRIGELSLAAFHSAMTSENEIFLLGSLTQEEWETATLSEDRLVEIRLSLGKWRVAPEQASVVSSTTTGSLAMQYKRWPVPLAISTIKNIQVLRDVLKNKDASARELLSMKEVQQLLTIGFSSIMVIVLFGLVGDDKDKSLMGKMRLRVKRELLSVTQSLNPAIWLSVPRTLSWVNDLGQGLEQLILLEDYKTKGGYKGVNTLKKVFIPNVLRQF